MKEQEKDFKTVLFEGLGLASMCWSETPKGVFDDALALKTGNEVYDAHLSDRDQFAMEFAKWVSDRYMYNNVSDTWLSLQGNTYTTSEKIFDLYKKSLTKTDKK